MRNIRYAEWTADSSDPGGAAKRFPNNDELAMIVRLELNENLDAIAGGENLRVMVFKLVTWAESGGRIPNLIQGAQA